MNNLKEKAKTNSVSKCKTKNDKVRFIVEREYKGTSTFSELFEPIVELMVKNDINQQVSGISDF